MSMPFSRRARPDAHLQQRAEYADSRQQQQDNGTHEFQPVQQGDAASHGDREHTLDAYLRQARQRGELPTRSPGAEPLRRADLRLAK